MSNMTQKNATLMIAALTLAALSGCTPLTPNLDAQYGSAVRAAIAQQTLNPDASRNPDPVMGLDGKAAAPGMNNYEKSFVTPEKVEIGDTSFASGD